MAVHLGLLLAPALAAGAEDQLGAGVMVPMEMSLSHGIGWGTTPRLELSWGDTLLRGGVGLMSFTSTLTDPDAHGDQKLVAGGTLIVPTLGVERILYPKSYFVPWVAAGLGYGWFRFDADDRAQGYLGIDSGRAAWYLELGVDFVFDAGRLHPGLAASVRALSSPVGMIWCFSFASYYNSQD
jgi:hypothetical protein